MLCYRKFVTETLPIAPTVSIFVGLVCFYWKISAVFLLLWMLNCFLVIHYLYRKEYVHTALIYMLTICFCLLTFASFSRMYEYVYFQKVKYQIISWHRFRAFFSASMRALCWNDIRYPLKMLLKQRQQIVSDCGALTAAQERSILQPDLFDTIRALNLGYLQLETTNSILSFADVVDGPAVDFRNDDVIMLRDEVSYLAFILELDGAGSAEISIMIHPSLAMIKYDKQVFRMLLVNAVMAALDHCDPLRAGRAAARDQPQGQGQGQGQSRERDRDREKGVGVGAGVSVGAASGAPYTAHCDGSTGISEVLIQIGRTTAAGGEGEGEGEASLQDRIEDQQYGFLSCGPGTATNDVMNANKSKSKGGGGGEKPKSWITVAVVDNGGVDSGRRPGDHDIVCEKLVINGLSGSYENFELCSGSQFNNIIRFSLPFEPINPCNNPDDVMVRLWHSPSMSGGFRGFERPSNRYEHIRSLYSKRTKQYCVDKVARVGDYVVGQRKMILVHADAIAGEMHCNSFLMQGWACSVVTSLAGVLRDPGLSSVDILLVCSSVLGSEYADLIPLEDLHNCGYYGGLACLIDGFPPPESEANAPYHCLDIPILGNTVQRVNDIADDALLKYILGAPRAL
jgi:hypothetical protein